MRRIVMIGLCGAVALVGVGCSSPTATSTKASASTVICSSITGLNSPGETLTLGGCTGQTGGTGKAPAPFFAPTTIRWRSGRTTTVNFDGNVHIRATKTCPQEATLTDGVVEKSSLPGTNGKFTASFCFQSDSDSIALVAGTKMSF
jgi:hypothetical protein